MGNRDESIRDVCTLKGELDRGVSILSGLQQPSHCESEEHYRDDRKERERLQIDLNNIAKDIVMALIGKEIEL